MRIGLIEAVWEGTAYEGEAGVRVARDIGYDCVDLVTDPLDLGEPELARAVDVARSAELPVDGTICVSLGIGDYNRSVQRFHTERAKRHVDFAGSVGASNMLLVIGEYLWRKEVIPPSEQWEWTVENVRAVALHADSLGIDIALELEPYRFAFVNSIGELVRFLDDVGVDAMKANLDLNHLWPMDIEPGEIDQLTGRIAHAHISDCGREIYENLPPGRGTAPLRAYLDALIATGFDGTMAVELGAAPSGTDPIDWVREGYEKTVELLNGRG